MSEKKHDRKYKRLPFYRRTFIVDRKSQYTILACEISVGLFFSIFSVAMTFIWQMMMVPSGVLADVPVSRMLVAGSLMWVCGTIVLAVSILAVNFLSNRLVGPLWRIEQHMKQFIEGQSVQPLRCRESDHFQQLLATYNQLLVKIESERGLLVTDDRESAG